MTQLLNTRANIFFATGEDGKSLLPHAEVIIVALEREYELSFNSTRRVDKVETLRFTVNVHSIDNLIKDLNDYKVMMMKELEDVIENVLAVDAEFDNDSTDEEG
jgi:hypothetical protein